ncbi:MAG: hypothetical protein ACKKL6_01540 [Candidatus Komeilibacteria bacterium]
MKKFFTILFVTFGVLFLIEIIIVAYLFLADPFGIKEMLPSMDTTANNQAVDQHPLLDASQEKILSTLGVDVANLPTEMTPELQSCLTEAVGADRAKEIMEGATPGVMDVIKAKSCL